MDRVAVVGAGLAGVRAAAELRARGFTGEVVLIGAEAEAPYDRPPLSKAVLAGGEPERLDPRWYAGAQVRLGVHATALRPAEYPADGAGAAGVGAPGAGWTDRGAGGELDTTDGPIPWDGLVLACGSEPLTLPGTGRTLRTLDDALRLRADLRPGVRVVLVGASWIGAEVTTAAAAAGCAVTVLEAGPAPLAMALGRSVGERTAAWYAEAGVELRNGALVAAVADDGVELAGGGHIAADLVLVGIGVRPAIGWLAGSGLDLDRGVLTDSAGRTNLPGVVAVGDCASRWSPRARRYLRGEHWDDALHSPAAAVAALLGQPDEASDAVPYVWSEQFGRYLQWAGWRDDAEPAVWRGDPAGREWAAAWLSADGELTGFLAVDRHRDASQARRLIAAGHKPDPVKLADPGIPLRAT